MKKLIAVLIVLVLITGMAFAQIADGVKLGAWGRTALMPLEISLFKGGAENGMQQYDGYRAALGQSWGGSFGRVRMDFSGANEFIGFNMQIQSDNGGVGFGDNAGMWVQPLKMLRLDLGMFKYDALRGKIATDTDFAHNFVLAGSSGDAIFTRFGGGGAISYTDTNGNTDASDDKKWELYSLGGALLTLTPIENLSVHGFVPYFPGIGTATAPSGAVDMSGNWLAIAKQLGASNASTFHARDVYSYKGAAIAAGYTIPNMGLARIQYVSDGDYSGTTKRVEAAFAYTGIENMTIDAGTKIFMPYTVNVDKDNSDSVAVTNNAQINVGVNMTMGDIGIIARVDTAFGGNSAGDKKHVNPFFYTIYLNPTYNLGFATAGVEMAMTGQSNSQYDGKEQPGNAYAEFGVGAWIMKDLGKGFIKTGVTYTFNNGPGMGHPDHTQDAYFRIPVIAQISF